ncbi:MAG: alpha-2-macroglobulin family protein [Syntrophobacteraceae bacterium]
MAIQRVRSVISDLCGPRAVLACIVLFAFLGFCPGAATAADQGAEPLKTLKITRITPSGADVPAGRQIVFEFNRPVVPLGKMARSASEIPITIDPALSCQWRWLSPSSLACQLDEQHAMTPATRYQVTVDPGITAEDGAGLPGRITHGFITQRPKITSARFITWLSPVMPQFRVQTSQPVDKASLDARLYFQVEGGARVASTATEDTEYSSSSPRNTVWLVSPAGALPQDKACFLGVAPGIRPMLGTEPGIEKRKLAGFNTLPQFRFLGVQCKNLGGAEIVIAPDAPGPPQARCNPASSVSLLFSSPVISTEVRKKTGVSVVQGKQPGPEFWQEGGEYSRRGESPEKGKKYQVYIDNDALSPFTEYRLQAAAKGIRDEFGRPLARAVDMRFATDHRPPDLHMFKTVWVLEKELDTELPILAVNLDQIEVRYETITARGKSPSQSRVLPGPWKTDATVVVPIGMRKLLPAKSGIVTGGITTRPPTREKASQPAWFVGQVTPFHVHVKLGHFNTVVWVTDLASGQPVSDVDVRIQKGLLKDLNPDSEVLAEGRTGADGTAQLDGTSKLDPALKLFESYNTDAPWVFVWCRKGEDLALVPLRYDFTVDSEGSNHQYIPSYTRSRHEHIRAWGATAQGIYKVGDIVQYKIYVRDQENLRFVQPPPGVYRLKVTDPAAKVIYQRDDITLSEFGAFDGEFPVPKNGAVGYYRFQLESSFSKLELAPMQVLVSDFTPSPFRVTTELNGKIFGAGEAVKVSTQARLHSGGPYGRADTRITATVETQPFRPASPMARGFQFDVLNREDDEETTPGGVRTVFETRGKLDEGGNLETEFTMADTPVQYGRLGVESSVRDDRGKSVAERASAVYFGRDRYVGLFQEDWVFEEGRPAGVKFIVVDQFGNAVPDVKTTVSVERLETKAARVKGAGDAYPVQYEKEWIPVEEFELVSGNEPKTFEFTPKQSGTTRLTAAVVDTKERTHRTTMRRWVTGKGRVVWESPEGNLLNVYAEKEEYRVGDTAKFLVQNPYPGAKALIAVERYGTLDRWVKTFESSAEVVEIPVLPDYLPGFYVSVMVMSPRVAKPMGPGGEDLGKPAFRMGYAKIEVKDQYKEILVQCKTDKETYKPRETVELEFDARPKNLAPDAKNPPIEIAVAVLDEAVFDLLRQKRLAFDPYQGFYHLDELDLQNYNLLMQLVGREKLEKKGASPAAAAGFDLSMRSVFKFVSYWNPSLRVDGEGKAKVRFQLPDNLTGWRVLAMAVTPEDRMGLGEAVFKVNQSTEIRPVMPNQVLEGDSFSAGFSVMNRTAETRNIEVKILAEGPCEPLEGGAPAAGGKGFGTTREIAAEPYKRYTVRLPMKSLGPGEIILSAQAGDDKDRDGMRHTLKVLKLRPQEVAAAYGSIVSGEASESVAFPEDMRPDASLVNVLLFPSVLGGLDGVVRYMKEYPYECWEQKISRAVLAGAFPKLAPYLPKGAAWEGSAAVADRTLGLAAEFQAPNGGMAFYLPKDEYVSPYLSAFTAIAFTWLRELGHAPPAPVEEKLTKYLVEFLKRGEKKTGQGAAVADERAVALVALAHTGKITRADLERHWKEFPRMGLFGKAGFLGALAKVPETAAMRREALRDILSQADQSAGLVRFAAPSDPASRFILSSGPRDNSAVLLSLLALQSADPAAIGSPDLIVRLMRAITQGRKTAHWASTQENVYAAMASLRYSGLFEAASPNMTARVSLDKNMLGEARFDSPTAKPADFEYRVQETDKGRKTAVIVSKDGEGRLYYSTRLSYAPLETVADSVNAGIEIHREYSVERNGGWVLLDSPMEIRTGELVRVDLFVSLPAERYFVVVDDPVPGGLEPVSRDLATASEVDAAKEGPLYDAKSFRNRHSDWSSYGVSRWSFYHKELRHDSARFYSERLGAGRHHLSYTAQAIAPGRFAAPPARAEEMYDPDVFGRSLPAQLKVQAAE